MTKTTFRHSDDAIDQVENIVDGAEHVESKSEFYQTITDYALKQATGGEYTSDIEGFDENVRELGLRELSDPAFEHFDFASTVYQVTHDESKPVEERMEYLQKLSRQEIMDNFPDTDLADSLDYF